MSETEPIKVLCAWCGVTIREGTGPRVSHGICPSCAEKLLPKESGS